MNISLESQIEGLLFVRTEGTSISFLAEKLEVTEEEVTKAVQNLRQALLEQKRGIKLVVSGNMVLLATHEDLAPLLASLFKEEEVGDLSPSALQTLSIILYKGGATRGEISYIRGVDSRLSIRNLQIRGLIQKVGKDMFIATNDALRHLGVGSVEELPRFADIRKTFIEETTQSKHD